VEVGPRNLDSFHLERGEDDGCTQEKVLAVIALFFVTPLVADYLHERIIAKALVEPSRAEF
jgi:hypothetical protein